jgi:uncharacterized membrane protein
VEEFMEGFITDWLNLALRWFHVIAAIAWIGESFYFVALDNSLKPPTDPNQRRRGVFGELWHVHGGGFYNMQKYTVAPPEMPDDLHWSKWPSYTTWLSGASLFTVLYLFSPSTYLIDTNVLDMGPVVAVFSALGFLAAGWIVYDSLCRVLGNKDKVLGICVGLYVLFAAWLACHIFAGRAAYLIVGAMLATIMSANVFFVIIPGQRKMVDAMLKGDTPNPIYGKRGKQRSVHNTYFTLPVLFTMISNHYAMTYGARYNWLVLIAISFAGACIRAWFVARHRAAERGYVPLLPAVLGALALAVVVVALAPARGRGGAGLEPVAASGEVAHVQQIVQTRCVPCHAAKPTQAGFSAAPNGLVLETLDELLAHLPEVQQQLSARTMPLGNLTAMTDEERATMLMWIGHGARH